MSGSYTYKTIVQMITEEVVEMSGSYTGKTKGIFDAGGEGVLRQESGLLLHGS